MSRRGRLRRGKRSNVGKVLLVLGATFIALSVLLTATAAALGTGLVTTWLKDAPDIDSPSAFNLAQTTKIYSADGKLLANLYLQNREVVPLNEISPFLQRAIVAVEDERYYEHEGVDYQGIMRAVVTDLKAGSAKEGASTITQQYIRNTILLDERTDITIARKVREMVLASELEKRHSKDEILGMYLNTVYFGAGAYGAEAASKTYFGKHAKDLNLAEAAILAGLPQSPSRFSLYQNPKSAKNRQAWVLSRMIKNGYISTKRARRARHTKLTLRRADTDGGVYGAPYFVAHVRKLLQSQYDQSVVFKGGLRVYTTIDTRMQKRAETAVKEHMGQPGDPDTALISVDPRNGHIKAMYGGRDFKTDKFNLATQGRRQPGSSFKTFVLVAALEKGIPPYRQVNAGSPAHIKYGKLPVWTVQNSEGHGGGFMPITKATWNSVNCVFARLIEELGPPKVVSVAKRMGITSEIPNYPSIALGVSNSTPLEMAAAYGTLSNNGVYNPPVAITKIVDSEGKVIYRSQPHGRQAVSRQVAFAATEVLQGVIKSGTARRADIKRPAAGKTGTSQNYRDAWFVGYTPQLSTAVWVGYHKSERPMRSVRGMRGFGGVLAAPIWHDFMIGALEDQPVLKFSRAPRPAYKWKSSWAGPKKTEEELKKEAEEKAKAKTGTPADPTKPTGSGTSKPNTPPKPPSPPPSSNTTP